MSSIATKKGDSGQTSLIGGQRVSKSSLRVEANGSVDELNSAMGFARSICEDLDLRERTLLIQRELFPIGSAIATPPESRKGVSPITQTMVDVLTTQVVELEKIEGILADWTIPGEHPAAAAYDVARTICRRAERAAVRVLDAGESIEPLVLSYLNRLSDLLWLYGRKLEYEAGGSKSLREANAKSGPRWSKAW